MILAFRAEDTNVLDGLKRMEKGADEKACIKALRAGGQVIRAAMQARIRRKSGKTADSIKVRKATRASNAGVPSVIVGATGDRAHIARLLETGYLRRNKRTGEVHHIPAYPWARPAVDASESDARTATFTALAEQIKAAQEGA